MFSQFVTGTSVPTLFSTATIVFSQQHNFAQYLRIAKSL